MKNIEATDKKVQATRGALGRHDANAMATYDMTEPHTEESQMEDLNCIREAVAQATIEAKTEEEADQIGNDAGTSYAGRCDAGWTHPTSTMEMRTPKKREAEDFL